MVCSARVAWHFSPIAKHISSERLGDEETKSDVVAGTSPTGVAICGRAKPVPEFAEAGTQAQSSLTHSEQVASAEEDFGTLTVADGLSEEPLDTRLAKCTLRS